MKWMAIFLVAGMLTEASAQGGVQLVDKGGHVTEATIVFDAPPAEVYRVATDYQHWPQILSDVSSVEVHGNRVRFHSRTFGQTVTVEFNNTPNRVIRFRGVEGPPGGRSSGSYVLTPVDGGARTRVTVQLYAEVVGVGHVLYRESKMREIRREKLARDLTDTARYLASHRK
ncbi:MAG: SRPBCC family protein [Deltaproteobacteria bacterium]|nr:SRPBCC family protein [Deltaproteobacteria bacterium]MCW5806880.1 SRPBCC family protein [Deltaproteobacteria bacterium]